MGGEHIFPLAQAACAEQVANTVLLQGSRRGKSKRRRVTLHVPLDRDAGEGNRENNFSVTAGQ